MALLAAGVNGNDWRVGRSRLFITHSGFQRLRQWWNDPANKSEALQIYTKLTRESAFHKLQSAVIATIFCNHLKRLTQKNRSRRLQIGFFNPVFMEVSGPSVVTIPATAAIDRSDYCWPCGICIASIALSEL